MTKPKPIKYVLINWSITWHADAQYYQVEVIYNKSYRQRDFKTLEEAKAWIDKEIAE